MNNFFSRRSLVIAAAATLLFTGAVVAPAAQAGQQSGAKGDQQTSRTGTVLRVKVHSRALTGNLEGDSPNRDVSIYLPQGYKAGSNKRYPVLYMLHGFTETDLSYFSPTTTKANIPASADRTLANGTSKEMIIVTPNAMTVHGGSNYSSGATTGDWETFISDELVSYVDSHYRTIRDRKARGIAGHSMGGFGALRIGMKHSDVFSSLYVLSSCCVDANSNIPDTPEEMAAMEDYTSHPENYPDGPPASIATAVAAAAAWAPNPNKPPLYFDSPIVDGKLDPQVFARMTTNRPLAMVDQYINNLRQLNISFDVGDADPNINANLRRLDATLTSYGVKHSFEIYEGNHGNRIPERFETKVLPFFSSALASATNRH